MLGRSIRAALFLVVAVCVSFAFVRTNVQAQDPAGGIRLPVAQESAQARESASYAAAPAAIVVIYGQPPSPNGGLLPSSRWDPDGSDHDRWVWDSFTIQSSQAITQIQWRGGYDPLMFGSGGPVADFEVAIYASIPGGSQPDVVNLPLAHYQAGANAGETPAGTVGGTAMYDYTFTLPTPFQAAAGTKYWVQIEAFQHGLPDWGIAVGTGGNGQHFRRIVLGGDAVYQAVPGDAAFTLLGPWTGPTHTPTPTPTPTAIPVDTATPTQTPTATRTPAPGTYELDLPLVCKY